MKSNVPWAIMALLSSPGAATAYTMPGSSEWTELETSGAFAEWASSLSSPDIVQDMTDGMNTQMKWKNECTAPFAREGYPWMDTNPWGVINGSNYELFEQPNGLCADHLSCAYVGCHWPFDNSDEAVVALSSGEQLPDANLLNFPAYVLHATTVGDIVETVQFANEHDIAISVKTSGHSYLGGSTSKGSILILMSSFPKLTDNWSNALEECNDDQMNETFPEGHLCSLLSARGKPAAVHVGGGQVWDEVYRAVNAHNAQNETKKYHIVGAAAGTVSAAGGWLSGGGLSGTSGMRMFGFGVDQILELQMVTANGWHIRIRPSMWEAVEGSSVPKTTAVSGQCNMGPTSSNDETLWDWQDCPQDDEGAFDFADLWYAVRGGGAGYGVVTAAVYQLHEKPGQLHIVQNLGIPAEAKDTMSLEAQRAVRELWISFMIDYFFDPVTLNLTEEQSNSCGSPAVASTMDPFVPGTFFCHNSMGPVMVSAWNDTVNEGRQSLQDAGVDASVPLVAVFRIIGVMEDVVELSNFLKAVSPTSGAGVPPGRMIDYPNPGVVPSYYESYWNAILPKSWLLDKERSVSFIHDYVTTDPIHAEYFYVLGGRTAVDHDQNNAISSSQREASFVIPTTDLELTERLLQELYGDIHAAGSSDFVAGAEYNHVGPREVGPLKEDWTKACPLSWSRQEKADKCISLQESTWGTTGQAKLIQIKHSVDPNSRFQCYGCVGYVEVVHSDDTVMTGDDSDVPQNLTNVTKDGVVPEEESTGNETVATGKEGDNEPPKATSGSAIGFTGSVLTMLMASLFLFIT